MKVTPPEGQAAYGGHMDATDPILLIASTALVSIFLAPLASRLIATASAEASDTVGGDESDTDLSRIRPRRRRR